MATNGYVTKKDLTEILNSSEDRIVKKVLEGLQLILATHLETQENAIKRRLDSIQLIATAPYTSTLDIQIKRLEARIRAVEEKVI